MHPGNGGPGDNDQRAFLPDTIASAEVKFGALTAFVDGASARRLLSVTVPLTSAAAPTCTVGNVAGTPQVVSTVDVTVTDRVTTCTVTAAQAFQYILPCVVPAP